MGLDGEATSRRWPRKCKNLGTVDVGLVYGMSPGDPAGISFPSGFKCPGQGDTGREQHVKRAAWKAASERQPSDLAPQHASSRAHVNTPAQAMGVKYQTLFIRVGPQFPVVVAVAAYTHETAITANGHRTTAGSTKGKNPQDDIRAAARRD